MQITLRSEIEEAIKEKVRRGEFESADAMVEQAVAFFLDQEREIMDSEEFRDTKRAVEQALSQGERGEGVSLEDFRRPHARQVWHFALG